MMNLNPSSQTLSRTLKWLVTALVVVAGIGFLDATYLTVEYYRGVPVACTILEGCVEVTGSTYADIGSVPIALFGSLYYLAVIVLAVIYLDAKALTVLKLIFWISLGGFLVSLGLVYLQIFVIEAICLYCMLSALTSTVIFITASYARTKFARQVLP